MPTHFRVTKPATPHPLPDRLHQLLSLAVAFDLGLARKLRITLPLLAPNRVRNVSKQNNKWVCFVEGALFRLVRRETKGKSIMLGSKSRLLTDFDTCPNEDDLACGSAYVAGFSPSYPQRLEGGRSPLMNLGHSRRLRGPRPGLADSTQFRTRCPQGLDSLAEDCKHGRWQWHIGVQRETKTTAQCYSGGPKMSKSRFSTNHKGDPTKLQSDLTHV